MPENTQTKHTPRLYRAKRKDNGEWVKGWYLNSEGNKNYWIFVPMDKEKAKFAWLPWSMHKIIPSTVGQSTGLKDKNGVEIFEGDIVKGIWQCDHKSTQTGIVRYWGQYGLYGLDENAALVSVVWKGCEVIGNIHDNEDLIKHTPGAGS